MADNGVDYKRKYLDLRARFVESLDVAFRTGYEQGANETQVQNMAQQAQAQAEQAAMMQQQGAQMAAAGGGAPQAEQNMAPQGGDEMDAAIAELEGLVNKSEPSISDLKKSLEAIKSNRMHQKLQKATKDAGKKMAQAPQPLSLSYKVNLPEDSKQAVSMQTKLVDDILNKWEQESQKSSRDITAILGTEGILKKD